MENIIYLKGYKCRLKKVICKRDNGKYIVENLDAGNHDSYYFTKFEEIAETSLKKAFSSEKDALDYINSQITALNDEIIDLNKDISKNFKSEDALNDSYKVSKLESEIEANKRTLTEFDSIPVENLDKEDIIFIHNIEKNIYQLTKAIKRLNSRIAKKDNEKKAEIEDEISKLESKIDAFNAELKLIRSMKKSQSTNPFFS